jgi:ATP-dependent Clp endopeptidase proteolytic subunit ClpP
MPEKAKQRPPHKAEIALWEAERDRELAAADKERAQAAVANLSAQRELEKRSKELSHAHHRRLYHFSESVSAQAVQTCQATLEHWAVIDPGCAIEVLFDSPGGSVFPGMNLFDFLQELRRANHHVTTSTRGMAASMAGILLQAGDKRVMGAESFILIHEISAQTMGKLGDIEDSVELYKMMSKRVVDIFAARSTMTKKRIEDGWRRKDWWIPSDQALKLGLVDEVR